MAAAAPLIIAAAPAPAAATSAAAAATSAAAAAAVAAAAVAERSPAPAPAAFAAFLSHAQAMGGDQVLVLREALRAWAPAARVWHDLDEQPTAEGMRAGVASAAVFVLFLSRSVLARPAVRHEVGTALALGKPFIYVLERDAARGGAPDAAALLREGREQQELALANAGDDAAAVERVRALEARAAAAPPIAFQRGIDRVFAETMPPLAAALGLGARAAAANGLTPFRMRRELAHEFAVAPKPALVSGFGGFGGAPPVLSAAFGAEALGGAPAPRASAPRGAFVGVYSRRRRVGAGGHGRAGACALVVHSESCPSRVRALAAGKGRGSGRRGRGQATAAGRRAAGRAHGPFARQQSRAHARRTCCSSCWPGIVCYVTPWDP